MSKQQVPIFNLDKVSTKNFDVFSEAILCILKDTFGFVTPVILLFDSSINGLKPVKYQVPGGVEKLVYKYSGKHLNELVFDLSYNQNFIVKAFLQKKFFVDTAMYKFIEPVISGKYAKIVHKLFGLDAGVAYPMIVSDECIGVIAFGMKGKTSMSKEEKAALKMLSEQVGRQLQLAWLLQKEMAEKAQLEGYIKEQNTFRDITLGLLETIVSYITVVNNIKFLPKKIKKQGSSIVKYIQSIFLISDKITNKPNYKQIANKNSKK